MGASAIYQIVKGHGVDAQIGVAPHDMRRSFARPALRGGAPLHQIQVTLGHESLRTTELYLGLELDLVHTDASRLDRTELCRIFLKQTARKFNQPLFAQLDETRRTSGLLMERPEPCRPMFTAMIFAQTPESILGEIA